MSKNTLLSELINYISANSSGNVVIAAPTSGFALDVTGTGRFTGALTLGSTITNGTFTYTLPGATGTLALTSSLGSYLPLAGGTLTGALGGTSATFSSSVTATQGNFFQTATSGFAITFKNRNANQTWNFVVDTDVVDDKNFGLYSSASALYALKIASGGAATFSSSVTASGTINTTAGFGILSGGGGYAIGPSSTRGIIALNGSGDQILTFSTQSYIYNSSSLFRMLSTSDLDFVSGGSQRMIIKSTGNVGIGTTSPISASGYTGFTVYNATTGGIIQTTNGTVDTRIQISSTAGYLGVFSNHDAIFVTNATERMRITSSGNVGIGTTSPGTTLHVLGGAAPVIFAGNSTTFYTTYRYNTSTDVGYIGNGQGVASGGGQTDFGFQALGNMLFAAGGGAERMRITSGGNVNITNGTITTGVSISIAAINTAYVLRAGAYSGLVVIRDNTNGGSGVWLADPNQGFIQIANNMPGAFTLSYSSGNTYIQKTSGNAINISVGFYSNILG